MAFQTIEDLLKAIREHPEWREELRRVILTEELLQLPERFERLSAIVQQLAASVQQLVEQGARHDEEIRQLRKEFHEHRQEFLAHREEFLQLRKEFYEHRQEFYEFRQETNSRLYRLERDMAELKGSDRERYYRERAGAIFGRYLRRVRLVDFSELYEELDSREPLTQEELLEVSLLDAVVEGRRKSDGTPVLLAIEASWSIYPDDVQRALARAQIIAKRGYTVYPVVAGKYAEEGLIESARRLGVLVVLDGGRVHGDTALM
ncbi:hypothetical protein HRbin15_00349 [bacterium HR15]|nr:hypothetical protein HRbin15_00349 [bacterium HR15]